MHNASARLVLGNYGIGNQKAYGFCLQLLSNSKFYLKSHAHKKTALQRL
jgi:hypothetical protein